MKVYRVTEYGQDADPEEVAARIKDLGPCARRFPAPDKPCGGCGQSIDWSKTSAHFCEPTH